MELLNNLPKTTTKQQKRVGRGIGSGVGGHTTGKGAKGDKVRGKTKLTFDGTKIKKSWIKRLPFLRGKHRTLPVTKIKNFSLSQLEKWFKANDVVSPESLIKKSKVNFDSKYVVKILSNGSLTKPLTFKNIQFSSGAKSQIISAGGSID
jgi:large subunit ribosomal protein L15